MFSLSHHHLLQTRARYCLRHHLHPFLTTPQQAVAVWEPPNFDPEIDHPFLRYGLDPATIQSTRPIFASFHRQMDAIRQKWLGAQPRAAWQLSMMARDPLRTDRGVVRGVVEPHLRRAEDEGVPVWIEAGNERARDVYKWLGCKQIDMFYSGVGLVDERGHRTRDGTGRGVPTWVFTYNFDPVTKRVIKGPKEGRGH